MSEPDKITTDQYGRKQWNLEEYAKDAKKKKKAPVKDTSKDYSVSDSTSYVSHRDNLLKESVESVKQHTLLNPAAISGSDGSTRNKVFGFFCPVCELSFRDNMALIDHLNSPQHIEKVKGSFDGELNAGVRRATFEEVKEMLDYLVAQENKSLEVQESFRERVRKREEFDKERIKRRGERRLTKRRRRNMEKEMRNADVEDDGDFQKMMGFNGFGSTKRA
ncbi:23 kDa U4/U6.U5 small nuclear ribonucleoprotein component [[Candida] railenensis]|uniref:23 kDa U4/U6.U5 small nuclear ribonucleoprotein component n=1 Tax=[Candida] railenensis TaxID=45579 RepID=A0A9P0VWD8_9ASCO|nr:23 kDa U4/U6.U5 small nuclear ribonucleoprotein component [[Candida] railenensis]